MGWMKTKYLQNWRIKLPQIIWKRQVIYSGVFNLSYSKRTMNTAQQFISYK